MESARRLATCTRRESGGAASARGWHRARAALGALSRLAAAFLLAVSAAVAAASSGDVKTHVDIPLIPAAASSAPAASGEAAADGKPLIRIGSTDSSLSPAERRAIAETFLYLSRALPQYRIEVRSYPVANLETAVKQGELDIFLATSGFYRRVYHRGLRDLVTMTTPQAPDPNYGSGAVFIVASDSNYQTVEDLRGSRAVISWPEGFTGYFEPLAEIQSQGHDPDAFFESFVIGGSPMKRLLEVVDRGEGDVAFARACTWEELLDEEPELAERFRPIGLRDDPGTQFRCLHSTALYPNWTIVSTSRAPWQVSRDVTAALLSMPPTRGGFSWAVVSDFASVDELYKNLRRGPYEYLRVRTWQDFVERWWPVFAIGLLLVAGLALHSWRAGELVKKRTAALEASVVKERAALEAAAEARRQKQMLEQVSVIGAMSSLITHELNAPLNAILGSARSIERWFENDPPPEPIRRALLLIVRQCQQAAQIVQHVRAYAKRREIVREPVDAAKAAALVRRDQSLRHPGIRFDADIPASPVLVAGDPLELELCISNLVKNAVEALAGTEKPRLVIRVRKAKEIGAAGAADGAGCPSAVIEVEDNAAQTRPEDVEHFGAKHLESSKASGLGLGLLIVRAIVERMSGSLRAEWADPGMRVTLSFPLWASESGRTAAGADAGSQKAAAPAASDKED